MPDKLVSMLQDAEFIERPPVKPMPAVPKIVKEEAQEKNGDITTG